jgi:CelD/BcsL family acetyltransferase involved in cellulose biosynthesis
MIAPVTDIEVIKTPEGFRALQQDWHSLWNRAKGQHHESFAACWLSWECVAKPMGRSLRIIAARRDGRLVAVWPLVRSREHLWTVLRPLSPGSPDHTSVLVDPHYASYELMKAMWCFVRKRCPSDIVLLDYVDCESHLFQVAISQPGLMEATESPYAVARLSLEADWDSFVSSLGTLSKKKPGALRRRLEQQGMVEVRILGPQDSNENTRMIDWMLVQKRDWADRMQKKGAWLYSKEFRNYLVALVNHPSDCDADVIARVMVLTLNHTPIAANMIGLGKDSMLGIMAGFDRQHANYAPGAITTEAWVRWALEQQRDFDLGVGSEAFKSYWSKGNIVVSSRIQIAQSSWGRVAFAIREGRRRLLAFRTRIFHQWNQRRSPAARG